MASAPATRERQGWRPDFFDLPKKQSDEIDVVSEYPQLVAAYAVLQVTSWSLALLEVGGVVGAKAHAALDASTPIDVALCLMMFLGTLHKGPVSDSRLVFLCRIGFLVDGTLLFLNSAFVFWPISEQHAIDFANATSVGQAAPINGWGIANGAVWFGFWGVVSSTVALNCLASLRRRMLDGVVPSVRAQFSTAFLRAYCAVLALQLGLAAWAVANAAAAATVDEEVLARKQNRGLCQVSYIVGMAVAMKCTLFDATGRTVAHFCTGRGSRASYIAVLVMVACVAMSLTGLALCYVASSSSDPSLLAADLLLQGPYIATYPFLAFWGLSLYNMGGTIGHLFNVDKAEAKLLARRQLEREGAAPDDGAPRHVAPAPGLPMGDTEA